MNIALLVSENHRWIFRDKVGNIGTLPERVSKGAASTANNLHVIGISVFGSSPDPGSPISRSLSDPEIPLSGRKNNESGVKTRSEEDAVPTDHISARGVNFLNRFAETESLFRTLHGTVWFRSSDHWLRS